MTFKARHLFVIWKVSEKRSNHESNQSTIASYFTIQSLFK